MGPRLHVAHGALGLDGAPFALDDGASRHIQVLRLQPGDVIRLFNGRGQEWAAEVTEMGRKVVHVRLGEPVANDRELPVQVTLAVGMPANDRMDAVVEKATELGAHAIQPLVCARSVLRLDGEQVVDADVRIYVQEVRAVHRAATDGGMRAAVRLPGMRRACPPCPA